MNILELITAERAVSGQMIADRLHISRAAVHKRIEKLRSQGYRISGGRNSGYRIISRPDKLSVEEIQRHLLPATPRPDILICQKTVSTQSLAREKAAAGAGEWTLVASETQSGSYGRMQRPWQAPAGGLWFSFILKPRLAPERIPQMTLVTSIAVCRAIEKQYHAVPLIKWPNDLLLNGKKLVGMLIEMSAEIGRVNWLVIGIGCNANNRIAGDLSGKAVSLKTVTRKTIDRSELLAAMINELSALYDQFLKHGFAGLAAEYNRRSCLNGCTIAVDSGDGLCEGVVEKVDENGYLLITDAEHRKHRIIVGDVHVVRR